MNTHAVAVLFIYLVNYAISNVLSQNSKTFRVTEKSPEGTVIVGNLGQVLGLSDFGRGMGKHETLLAISNAAVPGASSFKIDGSRGSLVVSSPPDRDKLCPTRSRNFLDFATVGNGINKFKNDMKKPFGMQLQDLFHPCIIQLSIVFGSTSDPSFDMLTIILEDINDHSPTFTPTDNNNKDLGDEYIIRIMETASQATSDSIHTSSKQQQKQKVNIPLPEATDLDAPENGVRHYRLEGDDAYLFHLEIGVVDGNIATEVSPRQIMLPSSSEKRLWLIPSKTTAFGQLNGQVLSGLDYEQRSEYRFVLVAVDGGMPPRSGRLPIRLIIEDLNDNAPIFHQPQYTGVMSEDYLPGHTIFQFQASDADGKYENHRINFRIPGGLKQRNESVVLQSKMPYSEPQSAAAALFEIELINLYDYDTKLADSSYHHQQTYRNSTTARLIVQRKSEKNLRQAAKYALEVAKKLPYMNIDMLDKGNGFDRERTINDKSNILRFFIEAYDFGKPTLSSQVPVFVELINVNDEAPSIFVDYLSAHKQKADSNSTCGVLLEGQGRSLVAQVTVTDSDAVSTNNEVTCTLNDTRFSLEPIPAFGMSNAWSGITHQHIPNWNVGSNSYSQVNAYSASVMLMYKLMSKGPLDREMHEGTGSIVNILISCTDNQNIGIQSKQLTSHSSVCINIEDVNDNVPLFTSTIYTFRVPENIPGPNPVHDSQHQQHVYSSRQFTGNSFGAVHAIDKDYGLNSNIEYSLSSNANGIVEIDPNNGSLYIMTSFDREKTQQFIFAVIATDRHDISKTDTKQGSNEVRRLSSTAEVRILITDVNDCAPEFEAANYNFEVEENVEMAEVGRVSTADADTGDFGRVHYRLAPETTVNLLNNDGMTNLSVQEKQNAHLDITSHFQIDSRLGIIRLRGRLDREKKAHYEFLVLAFDNVPANLEFPGQGSVRNNQISFTATATILVMVLDQNDNPPQILSPRNLAEFLLSPEKMIAGTTVFNIKATDQDLGENATIEYELMETSLPFHLTTNSDDIVVRNNTLLHENSSSKETEPPASTVSAFPFAIDRALGICYLKHNLPSLNSGGSNSYTFRIKAYDLGTPVSLNSTLTVRILRGTKSTGFISSDHYHPSYQEPKNGHYPVNYASVYGSMDAANGFPEYSMSDKAIVIILTTVFALLLLFAVLLFIFFRYRRMIVNRSLVNGVIGRPPDNKDSDGYIAGNKCQRRDAMSELSHRKPNLNEVLQAPWVNFNSTMNSPLALGYPNCISPSMSPRMTSPQLCFRSPNMLAQQHQNQINSATLKGCSVAVSQMRHARVSQQPLTPSAFVFRNYRAQDAEGYQIIGNGGGGDTLKQLDYSSGQQGNQTNNNLFIPSNDSSLLSKSEFPVIFSEANTGGDTKENGNLIRLNVMSSDKNAKPSNECDPQTSDLTSPRYQHVREDDASFGSNYVVQMPSDNAFLKRKFSQHNENGSLMFENRTADEIRSRQFVHSNSSKRYFSPQTMIRMSPYVTKTMSPPKTGFQGTNNLIRPSFVTPPRSRHATNFDPGRNLFRSLSIDSNFNTTRFAQLDDGQQYNQLQISPFASPKRGKSSTACDTVGEKKGNLITNPKTLSPKVRGSFV